MLLIADTSVLINFLNVDRMQLIGRHEPRSVITAHVEEEITDLHQRACLNAAIAAGHLEVITVDDEAEIELFARLRSGGRLGVGECAAIAVALTRNYALAIDDGKAIKDARAMAATEQCDITIWGTQDIIVRLIKSGALSVGQADVLLVSWRSQYRFSLPIRSFGELIG